ncbi:Subtilisin-like protease [Abeliophyllum distichum]|uniref:Subtilisin-like protease n=1 Tax=Abeliophyllum distichum TaxID=126358 RepID=A0ABD1UG25_9LAMI
MRKERQKSQAACWLQLSMFQTCKMTPDGDTTHDMKAIQKQVISYSRNILIGVPAIKSALMTISTTLDRAERPLQSQQYSESGTTSLVRVMPFDFGNSHVNPRAALDPRFIFDAELAGGVGGCRRSWRRLSPEVEEVYRGGKLVESKYG